MKYAETDKVELKEKIVNNIDKMYKRGCGHFLEWLSFNWYFNNRSVDEYNVPIKNGKIQINS